MRWPSRSGTLDADVVQIDEANLPGSPDEWQWAAAAINRVLDAVKTTPAVHLCFGNYGGQSIQKGRWGQPHQLSQRASRRSYRDGNGAPAAGGARRLPATAAEIGFGLGVIDVKSTVIEFADPIARSIERAERLLGGDRIRYIHPDCGFWMLKRNIADGKIRALVEGRNLHQGSLA